MLNLIALVDRVTLPIYLGRCENEVSVCDPTGRDAVPCGRTGVVTDVESEAVLCKSCGEEIL